MRKPRDRKRDTAASLGVFDAERDILDLYLREVSRSPLLSAAQETAVARRVREGDEAAIHELVTKNLRFVISVAKKYQHRGIALVDLIGEGNLGLLTAARKFDPDHGVKFISYAVWWVRQAVLKALAEQTRSVRIPLNQNSALVRMSRAKGFLAQELGREPTDEEIAIALNDSVDNIRSAHRMSSTEVSLDAPVERQDRGASTFGERVAGTGGVEIEEMTDVRLQREFIDRIFQRHLTPRERKILSLYYGLEEGSEALTLEKIGALLGVTRERIRQIRERAFEKLRDSPDVRALRGFWGAA